MKKLVILFCAVLFVNTLFSQQNTITIYADSGKYQINKHIYGHFAEHLGKLIYGGIWVGENSSIPNKNGIRTDIVEALKKIQIPNLRWPGGCFADEYHWRDGIGPKNERPKMVNTNWGGVVEDNSFGTHEFMDLVEQLNCEPVICGNVGSGTVEEMADWVEYLTADNGSPMSLLRKKNGREKPWEVKFWGVGNETWGCGGIMDAEYYANVLARYGRFTKSFGKDPLYKIAVGASDANYSWTEAIMKKWKETDGWLQNFMSGYSLHHYTITHDWTNKGSATDFTEEEWFMTLSKTKMMDEIVSGHSEIMDKYDPEKRIGLVVDEWGTWFNVEPGTNPGFLYQQNTLRDAMVAAINLDIFNNHCDRVKMANIAQVVNVLQAVILTNEEKIILTPTYHVFDLYKVHQDATLLPAKISSENYEMDNDTTPAISGSASMSEDGSINISLVNINPAKSIEVLCNLNGYNGKEISGKILTSENIQDHNTFEQTEKVFIKEFSQYELQGDEIKINMPSKSIVVLKITGEK